jgi:hypothetical protein
MRPKASLGSSNIHDGQTLTIGHARQVAGNAQLERAATVLHRQLFANLDAVGLLALPELRKIESSASGAKRSRFVMALRQQVAAQRGPA